MINFYIGGFRNFPQRTNYLKIGDSLFDIPIINGLIDNRPKNLKKLYIYLSKDSDNDKILTLICDNLLQLKNLRIYSYSLRSIEKILNMKNLKVLEIYSHFDSVFDMKDEEKEVLTSLKTLYLWYNLKISPKAILNIKILSALRLSEE